MKAVETVYDNYSIVEKRLQDGSSAFMLVDSEGAMCGVFSTKELAYQAIPAVNSNLMRGKMSAGLLKKVPSYATVFPPDSKHTRQSYRKK
jgi:hypothetical protein